MKTHVFCLLTLAALAFQIRGDCTNYFLAGEVGVYRPVHDSFVIPISNDEDIVAARLELLKPQAERRDVLVTLVKGADGINRNLLAPGAPAWSWHVTKFVAFGESMADLALFTPGYMEAHPDQVLAVQNIPSTPSRGLGWLEAIRYSVIMELAPQLCLTITSNTNGTTLSWSDLGYPYHYIVEHSDRLTAPAWSAAEGGNWPTDAISWTTLAPLTGYYRVRTTAQ